jgi:hypothetical protein
LDRIGIKGQLDLDWAVEFDGLTLRHLPDSITLLYGPVGILAPIRDLGLTLLPVQQSQSKEIGSLPF